MRVSVQWLLTAVILFLSTILLYSSHFSILSTNFSESPESYVVTTYSQSYSVAANSKEASSSEAPSDATAGETSSRVEEKSEDAQTCLELARKVPELYTSTYKDQHIDANASVYAFFRWELPIKKAQMEREKVAVRAADCRVMLKVKDRRLYVYTHNECYKTVESGKRPELKDRMTWSFELILLSLEVYDVPDVDFVMELEDGDGSPQEVGEAPPVLCYSLKANDGSGTGFTYPSFGAFESALGYQQMFWYRECLNARHPQESRTPKAVWRGSPTGSNFMTERDVEENRRVRLAHIGLQEPTLLNVGLIQYVQVGNDSVIDVLKEKAPIVASIPMENFNDYSAIIDLDGNAWSDRFSHLLPFNTPIVKQEYSDWREYFGHLVEDKKHVVFFKEDLTDLLEKVREVVDMDPAGKEIQELTNQSFNFALEHLSHRGVLRAMAYSMAKYASFLDYEVQLEEGYRHVSAITECCSFNPSFPKKMLANMKRKERKYDAAVAV